MTRFPTAALLAFSMLAGCASAGAGGAGLQPGSSATLAAGETVALPDATKLQYVGVRSDSRCPPGVQCIQAGEAVLAFRHGSREFTLTTGAGTATKADVGGWTLSLVSLDFESPPRATVRLDAAR